MGTTNDMSHERRPSGPYYEDRIPLLSQGDIFTDVPLAYPSPADELVVESGLYEDAGSRRFISGPLTTGQAMLITPTCSMRTQGDAEEPYAHPVRTLVPLRPIQDVIDQGIFDKAKHRLAESRDALINYMYLPGADSLGLEESVALLYMPITLHHEMIDGQRISQLTPVAARQLQKKLTWHVSSVLLDRETFDPPLD